MSNQSVMLKVPELPVIPDKYRVLVEPATKIGNKLGSIIAEGWDRLIDSIFSESSSK